MAAARRWDADAGDAAAARGACGIPARELSAGQALRLEPNLNPAICSLVVNRLHPAGDGDIIVPQRALSIVGTSSWVVEDPDDLAVPEAHVEAMYREGTKLPTDCPAYGTPCTPRTPLGAPNGVQRGHLRRLLQRGARTTGRGGASVTALDPIAATCPAPHAETERVLLGHGSGGQLSAALLRDVLLPALGEAAPGGPLEDAAVLPLCGPSPTCGGSPSRWRGRPRAPACRWSPATPRWWVRGPRTACS